MDNWLNTKAGRDFSMRTIPDMTKALNRLADALVQNDLTVDERELGAEIDSRVGTSNLGTEWCDQLEQAIGVEGLERDWQADAFILYKALSRFNKAHEHEEIVTAQTMAFDILSKVSWDFRNEYVCHEWPEAWISNEDDTKIEDLKFDLAVEHGEKKWISMIQWHCQVCNNDEELNDDLALYMMDKEDLKQKLLGRSIYPCGDEPDIIDYVDLLYIGMEGTDQHTDKPNEPMIGYEDGHFEKILNLQIGDIHVTEEPFNGYVLWRRVE